MAIDWYLGKGPKIDIKIIEKAKTTIPKLVKTTGRSGICCNPCNWDGTWDAYSSRQPLGAHVG